MEVQLLRTGKDEAERQRIKAQLYQQPVDDRGRRGRKKAPQAAPPSSGPRRGMTREQAAQLAADLAAEDAKLTGRRRRGP